MQHQFQTFERTLLPCTPCCTYPPFMMLVARRIGTQTGTPTGLLSSIYTARGRCCYEVTRVIHRKSGVSGKRKAIKYQFVDKVRIVATGGKGGDGCISLEGESPTKKRPAGGSGGAGGRVFAIADETFETLHSSRHHYNGYPGAPGRGAGRTGGRGKDVYIRVPCGTLISEIVEEEAPDNFRMWAMASGDYHEDNRRLEEDWSEEAENDGDQEGNFDGDEDWDALADDCGDEDEDEDKLEGEGDGADEIRFVADLGRHGEEVLLADGGKPGLGNVSIMSRRVGSKLPGQRGEKRSYLLELRTIADVGLVGYPNAGKSTLLGKISNAKPKVAMYPFTTLSPVVGKVEYSDTVRLRVADIPGLIDGAHRNRGLGHEFLRHVTRTRALMFVVDAAGSEGRNPVEDLQSLKEELRLYDEDLVERPTFVVANKMDLPGAHKYMEDLRRAADPAPVVPISALDSEGLLNVVVTMRELIEKTKRCASDRGDGAVVVA